MIPTPSREEGGVKMILTPPRDEEVVDTILTSPRMGWASSLYDTLCIVQRWLRLSTC
jgi:hypothetical protein